MHMMWTWPWPLKISHAQMSVRFSTEEGRPFNVLLLNMSLEHLSCVVYLYFWGRSSERHSPHKTLFLLFCFLGFFLEQSTSRREEPAPRKGSAVFILKADCSQHVRVTLISNWFIQQWQKQSFLTSKSSSSSHLQSPSESYFNSTSLHLSNDASTPVHHKYQPHLLLSILNFKHQPVQMWRWTLEHPGIIWCWNTESRTTAVSLFDSCISV